MAFESALNERFAQGWADGIYGTRSQSLKPAKGPVDGVMLWRNGGVVLKCLSEGRLRT